MKTILECPAGHRHSVNRCTFRHAPQAVKDYWSGANGYLLAESDLVYWFFRKGEYYAAQFIQDLKLEFLAVTDQLFDEREPF